MSKLGKCLDCKKTIDEKFKLCYNCNLRVKTKNQNDYKKDVDLLIKYINKTIDEKDIQCYINKHPNEKDLNKLLKLSIDYDSDSSDDES